MRGMLSVGLMAVLCLFGRPAAAQDAPAPDPAAQVHFDFDATALERVAQGIEAQAWQSFKVKRPLTLKSRTPGVAFEVKLAYKTVGRLSQDYPVEWRTLKKGELMFRADIRAVSGDTYAVWCGLDRSHFDIRTWSLICLERLPDGRARHYEGAVNRDMKTWIVNSLYPLPKADETRPAFPEITPSESTRYNMSVEYRLYPTAEGLGVYRIFAAPGALRGPDRASVDFPIDAVRTVRIGDYAYYPLGAISLVFDAKAGETAPVGWIETTALPAGQVESLTPR